MQSRQAVVDLITGRWRSQILHAGVRLGVFDALAHKARAMPRRSYSSSRSIL